MKFEDGAVESGALFVVGIAISRSINDCVLVDWVRLANCVLHLDAQGGFVLPYLLPLIVLVLGIFAVVDIFRHLSVRGK